MPVSQKTLAASSAAVLAPDDAAGRTVGDTASTSIGAGFPHPAPQGQPQVQLHDAGRVFTVPVNGAGRPHPTVAELIRIRKARGMSQAQIEPELQAPPVQEPKVEPFPLEVLPGPARRLVEAAARSLGCPPDLVAVPVLVALGAAIGTIRRIEVKPGWTETAAIYAAVVARPGGAKSPAQALALAPLHAAQDRFHEEFIALWQREKDPNQALEKRAQKGTPAGKQKAPKKSKRGAR